MSDWLYLLIERMPEQDLPCIGLGILAVIALLIIGAVEIINSFISIITKKPKKPMIQVGLKE